MLMTSLAGAIEPVNRAELATKIEKALMRQYRYAWEEGFSLNMEEAFITGSKVFFKVQMVAHQTVINTHGFHVVFYDRTRAREEYPFIYTIATDQLEPQVQS